MSDYGGFQDEMKPFDDYKRFNSLSIVALIVAPFTLLGFLHVGFSFVGIIGMTLGIFAVRLAKSEEYQNSGLMFGYIALAVAAVTASATYSYHTTKLARFHRIAHQHSRDYIKLIQDGEIAKAFEMQQDFFGRPSAGVEAPKVRDGMIQTAGNLISNEEHIASMPKKHPFKELIADDGKGKIEYLGPVKWFTQQTGDWFSERFRFTPADPSIETYVFDVVISRDRVPDHGIHWRMRNIEIVKGTDNPVVVPGQRPQ